MFVIGCFWGKFLSAKEKSSGSFNFGSSQTSSSAAMFRFRVEFFFCLIAVLRKLAGPAELTLQFPLPLFQCEVIFLYKVGLRTCRADTAVLAHYFLGCVRCFASEAC